MYLDYIVIIGVVVMLFSSMLVFFLILFLFFIFFFFFQAEDGIRDGTVTGVQTCALPISILLLIAPVLAVAQSTGSSGDATAATANSPVNRIERARALAAVHQLQAADRKSVV